MTILFRIGVLTLFCFCGNLLAVEFSVVLSSDVESSNNVNLVSDDKVSDSTHVLRLDSSIVEIRKTFQTDASFTIEREHYYEGTYEGETNLSAGLGLFNIDVIESFLSWHSTFSRTQTLDDLTGSDILGNRGHRNIFRSGPAISYVVSPTSHLNLSSSYVSVQNSGEEAADTERANASLTLTHQINRITGVNLNGEYEVLLEADGEEKFDRAELVLGLNRKFVNGSMELNIGRSQYMSKLSDDTDGNYFSVKLNRQQFWWHDVSLMYLEDISDTSIGFEFGPDDSGQNINLQGTDIVKVKQASIEVNRKFGNYEYSLGLAWSYDDYRVLDSDEKTKGFSFNLSKRVTQELTLGAVYEFEENNYLGSFSIGKDYQSNYLIDADYIFSEGFATSSFIKFASRRNSQYSVRDYEEIAIGIGLRWILF